MRTLLSTLSLLAMLAVGSTVSAQVSVGIQIGQPPPPPRAYKVPPRRNPNQEWVEGYWEPHGSRYQWQNGHWAKPPRQGEYWQEPYYADGRYYKGSWQGSDTTNGKRADQRRDEPRSRTEGR